jgi:hypothetical protein
MRKEIFIVTTGALLFNIIFWEEKLGINALLFDVFISAAIFYLYPEAKRRSIPGLLFIAQLVCLCMLLVHNSDLSKVTFCITLMLFASFAEYVHRSPWYAGGSFLLNAGLLPASIAHHWKAPGIKTSKGKLFIRIIRFSVIPIFLCIIFFIIYQFSNSVFAAMASDLALQVERLFTNIFSWFSLGRLFFLAAGFYLVGAILLKTRVNYFAVKDASSNDELQRKRKHIRERRKEMIYDIIVGILGKSASGIMALKNVNTIGIVSLFLLNLLLLIVNIIDIRFIWFDFDFNRDANIYKMVHEGTELLIVSIVLAMMLLIVLFKGNLNFYKRNKWLKFGAYAWILQNVILVISVLLRDYYYIEFFGLAYKRIGVLFFLFAVLTGLTTVFIKIHFKKSNYFLFRVNAWACIAMLIVASAVNWDPMIAKYNYDHNDKVPVDLKFIFTLSDKALPIIDKHVALLREREKAQVEHEYHRAECITCYTDRLTERKSQFIQKQQHYSWLSWNYADYSVKQYLRSNDSNKLSGK